MAPTTNHVATSATGMVPIILKCGRMTHSCLTEYLGLKRNACFDTFWLCLNQLSAPSCVPRAVHTARSIESEADSTWPSPIRTFTLPP